MMNLISATAICCAVILGATACSTASVRVMPGADGTNRVVVRDVEKHGAEEAAVEAATAYCAERGKEAFFLSDDLKYTGDMDEAQRTAIRKQAETATILGGVIRATEVKDAAVIFEGGGAVGRSMTSGRDYQAEVRFTCEL
ncbi:MAG: hypothetical protein HKN13_10045 [Rhodothermales bacterium]|nr:hypothetical protein [Rhodothermales bacterium]